MHYPKLTFQKVSLDLGDTYYGDDLEYYPQDVVWVAELLAMSRSAGLEHPLSVRLSLEDFYGIINTYCNSEVRCISEKGGDTVGVAAWHDSLPEYRYLEALAIAPAARGRLVGGAALQAIMHDAVGYGLPELRLNAQSRAISFYQRYGAVTRTSPRSQSCGLVAMSIQLSDVPKLSTIR